MKQLMFILFAAGICCCCVALTRAADQKKATTVSRHFEVRMQGGNTFDPVEIEINVGDTVTWINEDDTSFHTATSDDGGVSFDTKQVNSQTWSRRIKFEKAVSINYHCQKHPGIMKGKITVNP